MLKVTLESDTEVLDLDEISSTGEGVQAVSGLTGFGLPPVDVSWMDGANEGSIHMHTSHGSRDLDIPLHVYAPNRAALKERVAKVARVMQGKMRLKIQDLTDPLSDTNYHWADVHRVSGGTYVYGTDTNGEYYWETTVTLRAGSPYLNLGSPVTMSGSTNGVTNTGTVVIDNNGTAPTPLNIRSQVPTIGPVIIRLKVDFEDRSFEWESDFGAPGLLVDMETGAVTDPSGSINRYWGVQPNPGRIILPPGQSTIEYMVNYSASVEGSINFIYQPRDWMVV